MANLEFRTDLKLGNIGEEKVVEFLTLKGCKIISYNNDYKFDILIDKHGEPIKYEIKTDVKCAPLFDTGNIFIEFESRGKSSGISTTESNWFVTYFQYLHELWFIKTDILRSLINNNDFPVFRDAGDLNSSTHGYLINRKKFSKYFHVYKV